MDQSLGAARVIERTPPPLSDSLRRVPRITHREFVPLLDMAAALMRSFCENPDRRPELAAREICGRLAALSEHAAQSCESCGSGLVQRSMRRFLSDYRAYRASAHAKKAASLLMIRLPAAKSDEGSDAEWRYPLEELVAEISCKTGR